MELQEQKLVQVILAIFRFVAIGLMCFTAIGSIYSDPYSHSEKRADLVGPFLCISVRTVLEECGENQVGSSRSFSSYLLSLFLSPYRLFFFCYRANDVLWCCFLNREFQGLPIMDRFHG